MRKEFKFWGWIIARRYQVSNRIALEKDCQQILHHQRRGVNWGLGSKAYTGKWARWCTIDTTASNDKRNGAVWNITKSRPSSNPLHWWSIQCKQYPIISQLARCYLCICASSSASERVFSYSGHILLKHRSCLEPEKVNMLLFLSRNL